STTPASVSAISSDDGDNRKRPELPVLSLLPGYVDPRLSLEIIHRVILDDGDAQFERKRDGLGEFFSDANIERNEPTAGLSRDRVTVVDADVRTRKKVTYQRSGRPILSIGANCRLLMFFLVGSPA